MAPCRAPRCITRKAGRNIDLVRKIIYWYGKINNFTFGEHQICTANICEIAYRKKKKKTCIKPFPDGESNPALPRERQAYLPLYYRGYDRRCLLTVDFIICVGLVNVYFHGKAAWLVVHQ